MPIKGIHGLASDIKRNARKTAQSEMFGTGLALGTKTSDGVLVDGQKNVYSSSDCMMLEQISKTYTTESANGPESHVHSFTLNDISEGDRVLVALLGITCVIIGKVK